jgi:hypothetical protein
MANNRLRVAVEDRFIIFNLREDSTMLPEGNLLDDFVSILRAFTGTYKMLCDWSKLHSVTYDVANFVSNLSRSTGATILARSSDVHVIGQALSNDAPMLEVGSRRLPVQFRPIEIEMFDSRLSSWDLGSRCRGGRGLEIIKGIRKSKLHFRSSRRQGPVALPSACDTRVGAQFIAHRIYDADVLQ